VAVEFEFELGTCRLLASAPPPAVEVRPGRRVLVECELFVIADYEWEAFGLPDVRRTWRVLEVQPLPSRVGRKFMFDLNPE